MGIHSPVRRLAILLVLLAAGSAAAQSPGGTIIELNFEDRIRVSERSNLSRTEDGRYVGLTNRQVIVYLTRVEGDLYSGRALEFEQTLRDLSQVGRRVDRSAEARLRTARTGGFSDSTGVPRYLGIPTLPDGPVRTGDTWEAPGTIVTTLPNGAPQVPIEVVVAYTYRGEDLWEGNAVHVVDAEFGTRYPPPPREDEEDQVPVRTDINRISGRHAITILIPSDSPAPVLFRDEVQEMYELPGYPTVRHTGHVLTFIYGLSAEQVAVVTDDLEQQLRTTDSVSVEDTSTGARITIDGIRFVADQAVMLPGEEDRLDSIANALKSVQGARFLVVGHTADVGTVESQVELSWERARVIVSELVGRGLDPALFDLEGRGGSEPVASNDNESGRARNRRVEIYVLEE